MAAAAPAAAPITAGAGSYQPIEPARSLDIFGAIGKALRRLFGGGR